MSNIKESTQSSCFMEADGKMYDHILWSQELESHHFEIIKEKYNNNKYPSNDLAVMVKLKKK